MRGVQFWVQSKCLSEPPGAAELRGHNGQVQQGEQEVPHVRSASVRRRTPRGLDYRDTPAGSATSTRIIPS
jgi:hypothetical protein